MGREKRNERNVEHFEWNKIECGFGMSLNRVSHIDCAANLVCIPINPDSHWLRRIFVFNAPLISQLWSIGFAPLSERRRALQRKHSALYDDNGNDDDVEWPLCRLSSTFCVRVCVFRVPPLASAFCCSVNGLYPQPFGFIYK